MSNPDGQSCTGMDVYWFVVENQYGVEVDDDALTVKSPQPRISNQCLHIKSSANDIRS